MSINLTNISLKNKIFFAEFSKSVLHLKIPFKFKVSLLRNASVKKKS